MGKDGVSEEKEQPKSGGKEMPLHDFMTKVTLNRTTKDYVQQYLQTKVGLVGTESSYKAVLDEFLTRKQ